MDVADSYSAVARRYSDQIFDELQHKPLDRALLDRFAESMPRPGRICDLGCGPGQVARYLWQSGLEVLGIDISPGMIEQARRLNPQLTFQHGDMLHLDLPADALTGVVAFYSLIHIARPKVVAALKEIKRVLRPDGLLLFSFHVGSETVHLDEWWSCPVNLDFEFFGVSEVSEYLRQADFQLEEVIEREPYAPAVEHQSRRAYVFARRPAR